MILGDFRGESDGSKVLFLLRTYPEFIFMVCAAVQPPHTP